MKKYYTIRTIHRKFIYLSSFLPRLIITIKF